MARVKLVDWLDEAEESCYVRIRTVQIVKLRMEVFK